MDNLVSIVVPIYNVEAYLDKCIQSIQNQTLKEIEIILVDDGSTDDSGKICDLYKENDTRIKVIHQKQSGLTVVRRNGVSVASGKYIGFVDGDDWIDSTFYEKLYSISQINDVDIVTSSGFREYNIIIEDKPILGDSIPEGKYLIDDKDKFIINHLFSSAFSTSEHLNGAVWNKLFRKDVLNDVLSTMDDNIHGYMDDNVCVIGSVLKSKSIYISDICEYHHRERNDAFTYSKNPNGLMQINYAYLGLKKILENNKYKDLLIGQLEEHTSTRIINAYNSFFDKQIYTLPQYFFRSSKITTNSKIVIYGYGAVGKSYYKQFISEKKYIVQGIIDKNASNLSLKNIYTLPFLNNLSFDFIIIANLNEKIANKIKLEINSMQIDASKIIWEKPLSIFQYFALEKSRV